MEKVRVNWAVDDWKIVTAFMGWSGALRGMVLESMAVGRKGANGLLQRQVRLLYPRESRLLYSY